MRLIRLSPLNPGRLRGAALLVTRALAGAAALALVLVVATGQAQAPDSVRVPEVYRIGPEDTLLISVWKNDALTKTVPVRPDGMISLPLVHDVQAAGLTPMELRDALTKKLSEFMPSPEVSVILMEVRSFKVSVIGEVVKPARYELKSRATVLDVLAIAGGFNEFAKRNRVVILRPDGNAMKRIPFDYSKVIAPGGEHLNVYLAPGDIVLVP